MSMWNQMRPNEALVAYTIGNGKSDFEELDSGLGFESRQLRKVLTDLVYKHFVKNISHDYFLSDIGLLELSRFIYREKCKKTKYFCSFANDLPYLLYRNDFKKDAIFYPQLFFDEAHPIDNFDKQLVYEIPLQECRIDLNLLEVLCNLLYEYEFCHPTGFWILKCANRKVCGYGIKSLRQTLSLIENGLSLVFVIGFQNFIIFAKSSSPRLKDDLRLKIYLTRDIFPYIDTLDSIFQELKLLWLFLGIDDVPKGREIELERSNTELWPVKRAYFVPRIYGRIIRKGKIPYPYEIDPFIIAFDPSTVYSNLNKLSPWLATCAGGFMPQDYSKIETEFYFHYLDVLSLPDIDVITLMLSEKWA